MSGRENVFKRGVYDLGPMSGASRDCVWITANQELIPVWGKGTGRQGIHSERWHSLEVKVARFTLGKESAIDSLR
jgi:hypothetical protein